MRSRRPYCLLAHGPEWLGAAADLYFSYEQDSASSLTIEGPAQPSTFINLIQPPPVATYPPENSATYFPHATHVFHGVETRPRLGPSNTPPTGMAHAPRSTALPQPGTFINTREFYSGATPGFRLLDNRQYTPRSPQYLTSSRRHLLSPEPSPSLSFASPIPSIKMDTGYPSKSQANVPPLNPMTTLGILQDGHGAQIKPEINGAIDKGFFLADNEWTCYRRNYFSCICSYSLTPHFPSSPIQFLQTGSQQPLQVYGFAMSISAAVSDNDMQVIELVQHTPKRDKGPTTRPEKVRLSPKPTQPLNPMAGIFGQDPGLGSSRQFEGGYPGPHGSQHHEHTFERIQFKQATANNGKRRAAQQYYHLLVELWADVGTPQPGSGDNFVRVGYKKSAKMIVRGRSPGHYQSERRGSTSSGPGGSAGSIGGGYQSGGMGADYTSSGGVPSSYSGGYESRSSGYGHTRHHELPMEPIISAEEDKAINETKGYQYYPTPIYEGEHDPRHHVEMFTHHHGHETEIPSIPPVPTGLEMAPRVKSEYEGGGGGGLPSLFYPGHSYVAQRCGRFEGKPGSTGYYPTTAVPGPSVINMT